MVKITIPNSQYAPTMINDRMSFGWVSDDMKLVGSFHGCREQAIACVSGAMKQERDIAAAKTAPLSPQPIKTYKVSLSKLRVLVAFTQDKKLEKNLKQALDALNQMEKQLGLVRTTMDQAEGLSAELGPVFYIEGSRRWMIAPPMLSLFFLVLRNGEFHAPGEKYTSLFPKMKSNYHHWQDDREYFVNAEKAIEYFLKQKYWKVFGKNELENWGSVYDSGLGIYNFIWATERAKGLVPGPDSASLLKAYQKAFPHWKFLTEA